MRLEEITLTNFGSFVDATLDLRSISICTVTGQNGAGKSTLCVDSVLWALFGKCRTATDGMIRLGSDSMSVSVVFSLNGQRYRVIRTRSLKTQAGKSSLEVQIEQGGSWTPVSGARLADTQEKICALLNADFELLTATGFLLQGNADQFSRATPAVRKAILAQILRLDQYATLKQAANKVGTVLATKRDEKQQALEALTGTEQVLETLRREQTSIDDRRQRLTEDLRQIEIERSQLLATQAKDRAALEALATIPEQLQKAKTRRQDLEAKEQALLVRRDRLEKIVANRALIEVKAEAEKTARAELACLQANERQLTERIDVLASRIRDSQAEAGKGHELALALSEVRQSVAAAVRGYQEETRTLQHQRDVAQGLIDDAVRGYQRDSQSVSAALELARRDLDQAVDGYLRETETMRQTALADDKAVALLGQVPCDSLLQGRCQFTLQAVEAKHRLESHRPALAARLTDRLTIAELHAATLLTTYRDLLSGEDARIMDPQTIGDVIAGVQVANRQALTQRLAERLTDETAIGVAVAPDASATVRELEHDLVAWRLLGWEAKIAEDEHEEARRKTERTDNVSRQESVRTMIEALAKFTVLLPELTAADHDLAHVNRDMATVILDMAEVLAMIDAGRTQLAEQQTLIARLAQTDLDLQESETRRESQRAVDRGLSHQAGQMAERIQQAEADLVTAAELRKELAVLARDLQHYQVLVDAYAVIPILVLESSIPLLEAEANRILAKISTSGLRVTLETQKTLKSRDGLAETLDIKVRDVYGERLLENFSGGERARVDLAVRIGLSRLLANRAGAKLETLVVDEAFAGVDREGVEQLVECLPLLSQEFPRCLFITHDEAFKSAVAQQIVIHKQGSAGSSIEVLA